MLLRGFLAVGPVAAIGKPGTDQPELGAARDLVIGEDWLSVVTGEIDEARFITLVLGSGAGLHTELRTILARARFDRICIVVPPVDDAEATDRLAAVRPLLAAEQGWGDLPTDRVDGRPIVALLGVGRRRIVVVGGDRASAYAYAGLGPAVLAALSQPNPPEPATDAA